MTVDEKVQVILKLIADEKEAIVGYEKAITDFGEGQFSDRFKEIIKDEEEHIKELMNLIFKA